MFVWESKAKRERREKDIQMLSNCCDAFGEFYACRQEIFNNRKIVPRMNEAMERRVPLVNALDDRMRP